MKFGDVLENGWAGEKNPYRKVIFLKKTAKTIFCRGFDGGSVEFYNDKDNRLVVVGSIIDTGEMNRYKKEMKDRAKTTETK